MRLINNKRKIYFLLNSLTEFDFKRLLPLYFPSRTYSIYVGTEIPKKPEEFTLIIPINYRKIIKDPSNFSNFVIFHSSDLPRGRGWAPIANTILTNQDMYTLTGFQPNTKIDDGKIVSKISMPMSKSYTATLLRKWDMELTMISVRIIADKMPNNLLSIEQVTNDATFYERRSPVLNEIFIDAPLSESLNLLRAAENQHPCYARIYGTTFKISLDLIDKLEFPENTKINLVGLKQELVIKDYF